MKTGSTLKRKTRLISKVFLKRGGKWKEMTKEEGEIDGGMVHFKPKYPPKASRKPKAKRKKAKPYNLSKRKDKLWELCKRVTRARFRNHDGSWNCYTCGKRMTDGNLYEVNTGHGKAMAALPLRYKYDLRNLRIQCSDCNCNHGGATDIFIHKLAREQEGLGFLLDACRLDDGKWYIRHEETMGDGEARAFVESKIAEYEAKLKALQ